MESKVFVLFEDLDSATAAEAIKENIPPNTLVIGPLQPNCSFPEGKRFQSLSAFGLHLCRHFHLLKNDRTLFMPVSDVFIKINHILSQHNKRVCGNDDTNISDVLDIFRLVKGLKSPQQQGESFDDSSALLSVAKEYAANLKGNNFVDQFDLVRMLKDKLDGDEVLQQYLSQHEAVLLAKPNFHCKKSADLELSKLLFVPSASVQVQKIVVETPLDSSLLGGDAYSGANVCFENFDIISQEGDNDSETGVKSAARNYCQQLIQGYLRLLVNSRDELALSAVVCGPCGVLNHKSFTSIKQESLKTKMPMFQTMVSYVQKLKLGGKSYAPSDEHPFFEYNQQLVDFVTFMEKLQTQIEDEKEARDALLKIANVLRSYIIKTSKLKSVAVEESFANFSDLLQAVVETADNTDSETPQRNGGMVGRKTMKIVRDMVDLYCTSNSRVNLHTLLGKIPKDEGTTPLAIPSAATLFKSPEVQDEDDFIEEASLGSRLGLDEVLGGGQAKKKKIGTVKYGCTYSWATETSPVVVAEESEAVRSSGSTLVCPVEGTPSGKRAAAEEVGELVAEVEACLQNESFKKAKVNVEAAVRESKMLKTRAPKKLPKRSILKDIANMKTPSVLQEKPKSNNIGGVECNPVVPLQLAGKPVGKIVKQTKGKKEPTLIKGQTKLTSFFRI